MKPLSELQHQFQSVVLNPLPSMSLAWVSASGRAAPALQISVYSHAYRTRLLEVMSKDFSACHQAIGDDDFAALVAAYIEAHPSRYFNIRDFGAHFAEFIARHSVHETWPWLTQLAGFEWTLNSAFDAADAPVLTEQSLAQIEPASWPQLRFTTHPSLQVVHVTWNIAEMWKSLKSETPDSVQVSPQPTSSWLIWRDNLVTRFRSLLADEAQALACLRAGGDFDAICRALLDFHADNEVPLRAATLLKTWLAQGLLSDVILPDSN
jgi:hypothetical protein